MINMSYPNSCAAPNAEYPLYNEDDDGSTTSYTTSEMSSCIMDGTLQRRIHSVICSNSTYSYGTSAGGYTSNQWAPYWSKTSGRKYK